jgi:hypothetical protein
MDNAVGGDLGDFDDDVINDERGVEEEEVLERLN